ncbi:uncharacterized protein E0L32_010483 [Thyridium curvatum]|uniref:RNA polymerase II holoenzyme cyclin-like subunit n=1 Tax=Thyridium curvatum TaxID=1093900 RepID=A0A507AMK5_9PEZI|nr:uncharacterized protein E0L32_010483 [Thyridium curvatum]TPX07796.1 hypothetical protein E0L32_010483 [Thyridium curvatum]
MAANYWDSTQRRHWQFTKTQLASMRQKLEDDDPSLVQMFPLPQLRHLNIWFNQQINRLAKRLGVRQQPTATAQVYMKRFYTKVEIRRTNPYLLMATALYLACKMEETPQHIRLVIGEARSLWPEFHCLDTSKLGECEFFLISEMSSHLIIHSPYRTLGALQGDLSLSQDEISLAWSVINDHYMTDLPLLYPPHTVALTAILLALVLRPGVPGGSSGAQGGGNSGSQGSMGLSAASAALAQAQARAALQGGGILGGGGGGGNGGGSGSTTPTGSQSLSSPTGDGSAKDSRSKVQRFAIWLAESNVDVEAMVDCTQELIAFYECHEQYNDKNTREQINRFIKARGLDK